MKPILKNCILLVLLAGAVSCGKQPKPEPGPGPDDPNPPAPKENTTIAASQPKYYLTAAEDLDGRVTPKTAGLKVLLQDSKYYAVGERVLSVSYAADKDIVGEIKDDEPVGGGKTVTMTWSSEDPVHRPAVGHAPEAAEFGLLCLPGTFTGKFTVTTSRYTYEFTKTVTAVAGQTVTVTLDFAAPDVQPIRKVGIIGDSISTFDGTMCSPEYTAFYPANDPNVGNADATLAAKAVDSKEKTWWWRVIYDNMQHGTLDVNNSWSGTRVVHEVKNGRSSGKPTPAGFVDRAYAFEDPDIIIIHGGTNDVNQSSPLGTFDWDLPIGQLDANSYWSAMILLVKMLQNRYEGVQIIMLIGDRLSTNYEAANKAVAEHFGLPYVNFVGDTIEKCKGSHPTAPAFKQMADKIYDTCKDYLP